MIYLSLCVVSLPELPSFATLAAAMVGRRMKKVLAGGRNLVSSYPIPHIN
jgi:hypothetical protein